MPELAAELGAKMQMDALKYNAALVPIKSKVAAVQSKKAVAQKEAAKKVKITKKSMKN
jgi:DNA-binding XRE family transcriptional regulator